MEILLKCDKCGREAHNPDFVNKTCDYRDFNGGHCQGTLRIFEEEPDVLESYLLCDTCERRADNPSMLNRTCDWRLSDGRHCQGTLKEAF